MRRMLKNGNIKSFRIDRRFRITSDEIERFGKGEDTINLLEAAKMLGIANQNVIRRLLRTGQLTGFRLGARGPWRITLESIDQLMSGEA